MSLSKHRPALATASVLLVVILLLLHRTLILGEAFVPAGMLNYLHPWAASASADQKPPWNPLHYDAVGQFHVWRTFAGRSMREGFLPLWNPYAFTGYPFAGTSQSALFYPPNWLHAVLPSGTAAGWLAALHLFVAGMGAAALARRLGAGTVAATCAAVVFAFSGWQIAWLQLPTFAAASCWIPWVVLGVWRVRELPGAKTCAQLAAFVGLMLLGGHLQVAFYGLMAALLAVVFAPDFKPGTLNMRTLSTLVAGFVLGGMLAFPQVLPSLELSKYSHRVSKPSAEGLAAYNAYSMPISGLGTLAAPQLFGSPADPARPYIGTSRGGMLFNFAEGAIYVGIATLPFALMALFGKNCRLMLSLASVSLLMALGTPFNAILYFLVPGFGQSGSPGRSLVLFALAMAVSCALGIQKLMDEDKPARRSWGLLVIALAALCVLPMAALPHLRDVGADLGGWFAPMMRQPVFLLLSVGLLVGLVRRPTDKRLRMAVPALLSLDLLAAGFTYNSSVPQSQVYPATPMLTLLSAEIGHDRILPIHVGGFSFSGPKAVLPPNGAAMFGLRDVQGYDSLFPGKVKRALNALAGPGGDASPPEVGNMAFVRTPDLTFARQAGVRFLLSLQPLGLSEQDAVEAVIDGVYLYALKNPQGRARLRLESGATVPVRWNLDSATRLEMVTEADIAGVLELADLHWPGWRASVDGKEVSIVPLGDLFRYVHTPAGRHRVAFQYDPSAVRVGLFAAVLALGMVTAMLVSSRRSVST